MDIKPANFLMDDSAQPCLTDFETSSAWSSRLLAQHGSSREGLVATMIYLAPELLTEPGLPLTSAVDTFALGVTLQQLLEWTEPAWSISVVSCHEVRSELLKLAERMTVREPMRRPSAAEALLEASASMRTVLEKLAHHEPPTCWDNTACSSFERAGTTPHLVKLSARQTESFGRPALALLDARARDTSHHPKCSTKKGGCIRGAKIKVTEVERIQAPLLWGRYVSEKLVVAAAALSQSLGTIDPPVLHHDMVDIETNTMYLYHGTTRDRLFGILRDGFDEHVCQSNGLYGLGCYFAAEMCKALQYTDRDDQGNRYVLYCRVILGRPYYTQDALKGLRTTRELQEWHLGGYLHREPHDEHHSVIANPGHIWGSPFPNQVHREFVVYRGAQVYPEYLLHVRVS